MALIAAGARAQPVPDGFVDATTVVPGLVADLRYAGDSNFVGRPIDGYEAPRCLLTRPAAVQNEAASLGDAAAWVCADRTGVVAFHLAPGAVSKLIF